MTISESVLWFLQKKEIFFVVNVTSPLLGEEPIRYRTSIISFLKTLSLQGITDQNYTKYISLNIKKCFQISFYYDPMMDAMTSGISVK